ncbi:MAG TPA: ribosome small subunit-dependent GTPase A, partial [Candidatus Limnocylindrales bacterium]|nr:ribosome small subunit-dependent GTPase A [Candidatus Limnocylindrales bacterium]
ANVDTIFLVMALTGDFNLRRLERYLALAWSSGADPVVVLNKADLCPELEGRLLAVDAVAVGVPVHAVSAVTGAGLDALAPYLWPGRTVALLGSSGVGKSSLANALLGEARLLVNAVRADDERGRHTTTSRQLLRLPGGALLLDTPGMRSVGLWTAEDGLQRAFDDIASLEAACRFSDCGHAGEPGCAVLAAVADGSLSEDRLDSRRKLERELEMLAARHDPLLRAERRRRFKQQGQGGRAAMLAKRGGSA